MTLLVHLRVNNSNNRYVNIYICGILNTYYCLLSMMGTFVVLQCAYILTLSVLREVDGIR